MARGSGGRGELGTPLAGLSASVAVVSVRDLWRTSRQRVTSFQSWNLLTTQFLNITRSPSGLAWNALSSVYEEFRVHGMRVTAMFPSPASTAVSGFVTSFTNWPTTVFGAYQNASLTAPGSVGAMLDIPSARSLATTGPQTYWIPRLPKATFMTSSVPLDIVEVDYCAVASAGGLAGLLTLALDSLVTGPASSNINFLIEWDVEFRSRL